MTSDDQPERERRDSEKLHRILCLDGGGAKGFYTLGVLKEIEGLIDTSLHKRFDLIFGTSTGAIIAALAALGNSVDDIHALYREHVTKIMNQRTARGRSTSLADLAETIFGKTKFDEFKTGIGIVATKWMIERPMIFKANINQAHGRAGTFSPGFGCTISDAVQASCSAHPFFKKKTVQTDSGDDIELIDGGYCANNPTLYAIADAAVAMGVAYKNMRVVSIGVGTYPQPKKPLWSKQRLLSYVPSVQLLQKTLEINTQSMDQLRAILFKEVPTIRISDTFEQPDMATDLFESNLDKLNVLRQRGRESFASREKDLAAYLL